MSGSGFKDRSELARPGMPCPICLRPGSGDSKADGKCRISTAYEWTDQETGAQWRAPAGLYVHCFRVGDDRVPAPSGGGVYVLQPNRGKEGAFYTLMVERARGGEGRAVELVRGVDGQRGRRAGRRGAAPTNTAPAEAPVVNRLATPLEPLSLSEDEARMSRLAVELWGDRFTTSPGMALEYLVSRGLDRAWLEANWPEALASNPYVYCTEAGGEKIPALLAQVTAPTDEHVATHRIYLRPDGRGKADLEKAKLTLGSPSRGAIRLYEPESDFGILIVCEGIETGMAIAQAVRSGPPVVFAPGAAPLPPETFGVWSCLSTSGLKNLMIPPDMVTIGQLGIVLIAADVDGSKFNEAGRQIRLKGQRAARDAADRLRAEYPGLATGIAWPGMGVLSRWDEEIGECVPGRVG